MSGGLGTWRAVIADDRAVLLSGARAMLEASGRVEVVADGMAAIAAINREKPDLVFLDLAMPHANGIEVFTEARRWSPATRFVLFTGQIGGAAAVAWPRRGSGVGGVFLKTDDRGDLVAALPRIMTRRQVIAPAVAGLIAAAEAAEALTARELQLLHGVARGATNAVIAETLGISAKTVDKHRTDLMRKLGAHSTADLVMTGVRLGLIDAGG